MKLEQLIAQHFYTAKEITLQGIGKFRLNPTIALPTEVTIDTVLPENSIDFKYDLKSTEDTELINFISKQTGKIKPLASADLDSYLILAKQFLNIGKPFSLEGIGTIQKKQQGDYEFIPGQFITPKIDDFPKQLREKRDESVSFESVEKKTDNNKRNILAIAAFALIALIGLSIFYFIFSGTKNGISDNVLPINNTSNLNTDLANNKKNTDTLSRKNDTLLHNLASAPIIDGSNFKVVIKEYPNKFAAEKAIAKLTSYGHKLVLENKDNTTFKLAMPINKSLADTLLVKDSLRKFFGGNPYIEYN